MELPTNNTSGPLSYCDDTVYCNWTEDNNHILSSDSIIENLGNVVQDKNVGELLDIKTELLESLEDTFKTEIEQDSNLKKEVEEINSNISMIESIMSKIKTQQGKVLDIEILYKKSIDETKDDLEKINTFHQFLKDIIDKFPGDENEEINHIKGDIVKLGDKIKQNNECSVIKKEYQKELYLLNEYQRLLKKINNGNVGNTCSLCLQKSVSKYFNPCGHTACDGCIKQLYDKSGSPYNVNCFICRKRINSNHPIYFI